MTVNSCLEIKDLAASDPKIEALTLAWKAALSLCSITWWCTAPYITLTDCPAVVISVNWAFSVTALTFFKLTVIFLPFNNLGEGFLYGRLNERSMLPLFVPYSDTEGLPFTVEILNLLQCSGWVVGSEQHRTKHELKRILGILPCVECSSTSLGRFAPTSGVQAGETVPYLSREMYTCGFMWIMLVLDLFSSHCANLHRDQLYFSWTFVAVWTSWTAALRQREFWASLFGVKVWMN